MQQAGVGSGSGPVGEGARAGRAALVLGLVAVAVALGLLTWSKYQPYLVKVPAVLSGHTLGPSIVTGDGSAAPPVSVAAGWDFTVTYLAAVWKALVAGLVLAAAVQVLLPRGWLRRSLGTAGGVGGGIRGGLWSLPTLMCSCCAAPVAVGLRRMRVSLTSAVAFWLGNPALNPVVLVFCLAVLPWPWAVLRLAGGLAVVAGGVAVARWAERRGAAPDGAEAVVEPPVEGTPSGAVPLRFLRALAGLSVRLLPEFAVVVFLLGMFRGVLFPLGADGPSGVLLTLVLVLAGLLLPVPTGGEVAVVAAVLAAGLPGYAAAALLLTLPVLSLPSVLMVRRAFPGRVVAGTVGAAAGVGLVAAALAPAVL